MTYFCFTVLSILLWLFQVSECQGQGSSFSHQGSSLSQQAVPGASVTPSWPSNEGHSVSVTQSTPVPSSTPSYTTHTSPHLHSAPSSEGHVQDGNPGDSFHQSSLNTSRHNSTPKDKKAEEFPGELSIISPTIGNHENSDHGTTNSLETSSRTTEEVSSTPPPALTADPLDISIIPSHSSTFTSLSSPTTILPSQNPSHPLNPIHESSLHTSATPTLPNPPVVQSTPSKTSPTEYTEGSQNFTDSFLPSSSSQDLRELATDSVSKQEMIDFTSVSVQPTMSQPFRGTPGVDTPTNTVDPDPNHSPINGSADDRQGLGYSEATPSSEPWNETSVLPPGFEEGGLGVGGIVGITLACSVLLVAGTYPWQPYMLLLFMLIFYRLHTLLMNTF